MNVTAGILEQSPHDCESPHPVTPTGPAADPATPAMERWVPSCFTLRADTDEDRRFELAIGRRHYRSDTLDLTLLAGGTLEPDHDKAALWAAPYFQSDPKCKKCVVLPQCQGFTCPLPRVRDGRRSCAPVRTAWKKQLLSMAKLRRQEGRHKFVEDPG